MRIKIAHETDELRNRQLTIPLSVVRQHKRAEMIFLPVNFIQTTSPLAGAKHSKDR